jgi:crotonobetainyl-CoA:carnitine CoA-transferase CaiB-like acyl-CoA transferase
MAEDARLAGNAGRVQHEQEIDDAITAWTSSLDAQDVLRQLEAASVPSGPIYNVEDMVADPHFQARGLFEEVYIDGNPLKIPALVPKLSETPGGTSWPGPAVGAHNDEVFKDLLGMSDDEVASLHQTGII